MDSLNPTVLIIAGPNGSGKTTFYLQFLKQRYPTYVNADEIALALDESHDRTLRAAKIAEQRREALLLERRTFAFETVFSRTEYWIDFIFRAMAFGFRVELIFFCTAASKLNVARVETRVQHGGHPVFADKILKRYPLSIQTALLALQVVNEFWLYDNTNANQQPRLLGRFVNGELLDTSGPIPLWAIPFFVNQRKQWP